MSSVPWSTATAKSIRRAGPADAESLGTLRRTVGWSAGSVDRQLIDSSALIFVAELDGRVIGTVTLALTHADVELADSRHRAFISDLAVGPEWQRRGVGSDLLAVAEAEARRRGFEFVTLTVDEHNYSARRLYERRGYRWFKDVNIPWRPGHALTKRLT